MTKKMPEVESRTNVAAIRKVAEMKHFQAMTSKVDLGSLKA
jgi:hypothetical protein